jgi:hypothetical protein
VTAHDRYLVRRFNRAFGDIEWQEELTSPQQGLQNLRWIFKDGPADVSGETFQALSRELDAAEIAYTRPNEMVKK